ncbi:Replicative DNA helicase [Rosistilla ulvae]|uniref:Replicative DNA helicase n=1 Tax=Rosistilla ulvae TaxID=1930277 RepID=A0A517M7T0_9BACT|nr:DnaB-like helicase C-terminal domain-containing protein [Rosistilla ulvae]QDS90941.1 Replicative DNA helicase [Rosistilla ulvae]
MKQSIERIEEAEIGLCAACMDGGSQAIEKAQQIVSEGDFLTERGWGELYSLLCRLNDAETSVSDHARVISKAKACGVYDAIGGTAGFERLSAGGTAENLEGYARDVRDAAIDRQLRASLTTRLRELDDIAATDVRAALESDLVAIDSRLSSSVTRRTIGDAYGDVIESIRNATSNDKPKILTGFDGLDRKQGGLRRGALHVIAARPSDGKTSLGLNMAENMAELNYQVLFASMEMAVSEIAERSLAARADVNSKILSNRKMRDSEREKVEKAVQGFEPLPLTIQDASGMTVNQLRGIAKVQRNETGLDVMFVDYLSCIGRERGNNETDYLHYTHCVRQLRLLARELNIALVLLCQLNRQAEQGKRSERPKLSHLKETGAIEQDAHSVTFIHREYPDDPECELYFAKWRDGERGWALPMFFNSKFTKFTEQGVSDITATATTPSKYSRQSKLACPSTD